MNCANSDVIVARFVREPLHKKMDAACASCSETFVKKTHGYNRFGLWKRIEGKIIAQILADYNIQAADRKFICNKCYNALKGVIINEGIFLRRASKGQNKKLVTMQFKVYLYSWRFSHVSYFLCSLHNLFIFLLFQNHRNRPIDEPCQISLGAHLKSTNLQNVFQNLTALVYISSACITSPHPPHTQPPIHTHPERERERERESPEPRFPF